MSLLRRTVVLASRAAPSLETRLSRAVGPAFFQQFIASSSHSFSTAIQPELNANEFRSTHEIDVKGSTEVPDPLQTFDSCENHFHKDIVTSLRRAGFQQPSPIQGQSWAIALNGRDLISIGSTGSGKTLGFLLPAFQKILAQTGGKTKRRQPPLALVIAPTRELALQIEAECKKFGSALGITSVCLYGGAARGVQGRGLMMGAHIVIGTPGRLNDFMTKSDFLDPTQIQYLVLDEADRMLDMGFEPQIRSIISCIPKERQTLMFSATWPREVQALAHQYLKPDYFHIKIGGSEELVVNKNVKQEFHEVAPRERRSKLLSILQSLDWKVASVLIFANKKFDADWLAEFISDEGFARADAIHGDKSQDQRVRILQNFSSGRSQVLVATDVAARGLDMRCVTHVINYEFPPGGVEDWVHRVGRTGRAGDKGHAHTLINPDDDHIHFKELGEVITRAGQAVPPLLFPRSRSTSSNFRSGRPPPRNFRKWGDAASVAGTDFSRNSDPFAGFRRRDGGDEFGRGGGDKGRSQFGQRFKDSNRSSSSFSDRGRGLDEWSRPPVRDDRRGSFGRSDSARPPRRSYDDDF